MHNYIYDDNNIFAKILRKEIPCEFVYENNYAVAFHDISPEAPVHILVIPKGQYVTYDHFYKSASDNEKLAYFEAITQVINKLGLADSGYRLVSNAGRNANQSVHHFHTHLLAGTNLGLKLLPNKE